MQPEDTRGFLAYTFQTFERHLGMSDDAFARFGQANSSAGAFDQDHSQVAFESSEGVADTRLRNPNRFGGTRDIADVFNQICELL